MPVVLARRGIGLNGGVFEIGRERDLQRQGAQQAEARAERAVELAQERVVPAYERL